jgi:uncharacterized membrane protein
MIPLTLLDGYALAVWFSLWLFYLWFAERTAKNRVNLATGTQRYRRMWMQQAFHRENRALDAILVGNLMHSSTFFSSTTLLIIGALFAWAGGPDRGAELLQAVPFAKRDSYILFEFKVLTLAAVMVYALLRFTWAIRQFNLVSILIGAYSRENKSPIIQQPDAEDAQLITRAARLNELAGTNFTQGLRAYYYAVPLLMWLANAWLLILGSLAITFASYYMEFRSDTVKALSAEYNPEDSLIKDSAPGKKE